MRNLMTEIVDLEPHHIPVGLRVEVQPENPACYRLVDCNGAAWAQYLPNLGTAKLMAGSPELFMCFEEMVETLELHMRQHIWDIDEDVSVQELACDEGGALDDIYIGAPKYARWLLQLRKYLTRSSA